MRIHGGRVALPHVVGVRREVGVGPAAHPGRSRRFQALEAAQAGPHVEGDDLGRPQLVDGPVGAASARGADVLPVSRDARADADGLLARRDVLRPDDGAVGRVDKVEAGVAHECAVDEPVGGVGEREYDQLGHVHGRSARSLHKTGEGVVARERGDSLDPDILVDLPEERDRLAVPGLTRHARAVDRHAVEVLGEVLVGAVGQQTVGTARYDDQVAGQGHRVDRRGVDGPLERVSAPLLELGGAGRSE